MSLHELAKTLSPRRLESRLLRDLTHTIETSDQNDEVRVIRSTVFNAYQAGKIHAVRELHRQHDYSMGEYDLEAIQEMRVKYLRDVDKIKRERILEEPAKTQHRIAALASALVWEAYNLGKLSTFRQRAQGKIGQLAITAIIQGGSIVRAQLAPTERIFWITETDDRVCDICLGFEMVSIQRDGWNVWDPSIPSIPYDSHPFCRCEYETLETKEY